MRKALLSILVSSAVLGYGAPALAPSPVQAQESPAPPTPPATGTAPQERATLLAARVLARDSGRRVEVTDLRTETTTVFVNPDGTFTSETAPAPVRAREEVPGAPWEPVDTTLELSSSGHYKPKAAVGGLLIGLGGGDGLAGLSRRGKRINLKWQGMLPRPNVDGDTATYAEVLPGVDITVQAKRSGYEQSFVLKRRPPNRQIVYRLPLAAPGVTVTQTADGGFRLTDSDGALVGLVPQPVMFDSQRDPITGDPTNVRVLDVKLKTSANGTELQVAPDKDWLAASTTQYPVVLDPDVHLGLIQDTWVSSNVPTQTFSTAVDLRSGKLASTAAVQKSLLQFDTSRLPGTLVKSATLALYNNQSASCDTSKVTNVYLLSQPFSSTTSWNSRPNVEASVAPVTARGSFAGSSCASAGFLRWDVTAMAARWAAGYPNHGLAVAAADENDTTAWKRFASADNGSNSLLPSLAVTYNSLPAVPSNLSLSPTVAGPDGRPTTGTRSPSMSASACDSDGSPVAMNFEIWNDTRQLFSILTGAVPSCGTSSAGPPADLLSSGSYRWRVRSFDGSDYSAYTGFQSFVVDLVGPNAPPGVQLTSTSGSNYTFTLTRPTSDTTGYRYGFNPQNLQEVRSSAGSVAVTVPGPDGLGTFSALPIDLVGNPGPATPFELNQDVTTLLAPKQDQRTSRTVALQARSRPGWAGVTYEYSGDGGGSWRSLNTDTDGNPTQAVTTDQGTPQSLPAPVTDGGSSSSGLRWNVSRTLAGRDGTIEVRACFVDDRGRSCSPASKDVHLDQLAAGPGYATRELGPGLLSLATGNHAVTEDDVTDGTGTTDLTLSRTFNSLAPNASSGSAPFGPGWTASLPVDSAAADYTGAVDSSTQGVVLRASDGASIAFSAVGNGRWEAVGDDATSGLRLVRPRTSRLGSCPEVTVNGAANTDCLLLEDLDGNSVTFYRATTSAEAGTTHVPVLVSQPGAQTTSYTWTNGRVTRITGALPPAASGTGTLSCTGSTSSTFPVGCRALDLAYVTTPTGDRLSQVELLTHRDGAVLTVPLSCYSYDSTGRLQAQWDPRLNRDAASQSAPPACADNPSAQDLPTRYEYTASGQLARITPPGLSPWLFEYTGQRLTAVRRLHLSGQGGTETTRVVYDLPLDPAEASAPLSGLPDMRPAEVGRWAQSDVPVTGTALFGPDDPTSRDARDAELVYLDVESYEVNTAQWSRGWRISTTEHDSAGQVVRTLDPANRDIALQLDHPDAAGLDLPASSASDTPERARRLSRINLYRQRADGTPSQDLLQTFGPLHRLRVPGNPALVPGRSRTDLTYDSGTEPGHPNAGKDPAVLPDGERSLHLVVRSTTGASLEASPTQDTGRFVDQRTTTQEYSLGSDATGWTVRRPMRTVEDAGGLNRTTTTTYDPTGLVLTSTMPAGNTSSRTATGDAGALTMRTSYYTGSGTGPCVNAAWVRLPCTTGPAAQPGVVGLPGLPTTTYTYDYALQPRTTSETVTDGTGTTVTRTTDITYDSNGWAPRPRTSTTSGGVGATTPPQEYDYDPTTGLPTVTSSSATPADSQSPGQPGGTLTTGYDDFGRPVSFTDADGNNATIQYDLNSGRVTSRSNRLGTVTYTYDGNDERRDLITGMQISGRDGVPGLDGTFSATYNGAGQLTEQTWPNQVTATSNYNTNREAVGVRYANRNGTALLTHDVQPSVHSQWQQSTSTTGAQDYTYDNLGRLLRAEDTPAPINPGAGACTTRQYSYDINSNRLTKRSSTSSTCAPISDSVTPQQQLSYDTADRLQPPGGASSMYDAYGRIINLPGAWSPNGQTTATGYYTNDLVQQQISGGRTLRWTLDPAQRPRTFTDTAAPDGNSTSSGAVKTNHYDDPSSDSPSWVDESSRQTPAGQPPAAWTRNLRGVDGQLVLLQTSTTGYTYQLANLHGDVAVTLKQGDSTPREHYAADEFGVTDSNLKPEASAGDPSDNNRYNWLGGATRSAQTSSGMLLMGVRLYDPTLGRFLQVDSVRGGSANAYDYAYQDPSNVTDLDGRCPFCAIGLAIAIRWGAQVAVRRLAQQHAARTFARRTVVRRATSRPRQRQSQAEREAIFRRDNYRCQICGRETVRHQRSRRGVRHADNERQVDHSIPWSRGGPNSPWNTRTACRRCNIDKSDRM